MTSAKTVFTNTSYLMLSSCAQKVLTFIYFSLIARYTGLPNTGLYFLIISVWTLFSALMDFGLTPILIREIAKYPEKLQAHLSENLGLKLILCVIGALAATATVYFLNYPSITRHLVLMVIVGMVLDSFYTTFYGCLRAVQKMGFEAIGTLLAKFIILAVGGVAIWLRLNLYFVVGATVLGSIFNFFYAYAKLKKILPMRITFTFDTKKSWEAIKPALPIFFSNVFGSLLFLNTLILSYLTNEVVVSMFSIPSTIATSLLFIPVAVSSALYPVMSHSFQYDPAKLPLILDKGYHVLAIFIIPLVINLNVVAEPVIKFLFGSQYGKSVIILQVLALSLIPIYFNHIISAILDATHNQHKNMIVMLISGLLNVVLALILIPRYEGLGIAIAAVISHTLMFLLGVIFIYKNIAVAFRLALLQTCRILLASLLTASILYAIANYFHVLILVPASIIIYAVLLFLMQGVSKQGFKKDRALGLWQDFYQTIALR